MTNCPNCGAPITVDVCEYCGTVFRKVRKQEVFYADNIAYPVHAERYDIDLACMVPCEMIETMTPNEYRSAMGLEQF